MIPSAKPTSCSVRSSANPGPASSCSTSTPRPPPKRSALGWYLDGRVTAVLGTHTHIPTADERVLPGGTAFQTDVGMSGPYDSVIGVEKELVLQRFLTGMPGKFEAAKGNPKMCAALISCDGATGRATGIRRLMLGE